MSYAHAGPGSPGNLLMEMFAMQAGFKAIPVPYRGNAQLVIDLVGGQIKAGFVGSGGLFQHVRDGKLRALAVSTPERSPLLPAVPTIGEAGYPDVKFDGYFVLAAPAALPDPIATLLEHEVQQALQAPDLQEKLRAVDINSGRDDRHRSARPCSSRKPKSYRRSSRPPACGSTDPPAAPVRLAISAARSAGSRAPWRRYKAGAGGRSSGAGPRSFPSTARSSRPCAPARTAP